MYIQYENTHTQEHHNNDYMPEDYVVEPNEDGVAQVTQEVGEALLASYDNIHEYTKE